MNIPKKKWCEELFEACMKDDKTLCDIYYTSCLRP